LKNFDQDVKDTNKMAFVYNFDSAAFKGKSMAGRIHNEIIKPALKEIRGLVIFHLLDCNHPTIREGKHDLKWNFGVCEDSNKEKMPSLTKVIPPILRKNPYTGKPMIKSLQ